MILDYFLHKKRLEVHAIQGDIYSFYLSYQEDIKGKVTVSDSPLSCPINLWTILTFKRFEIRSEDETFPLAVFFIFNFL